ncbi:MAG: hypothetical protein HYU39_10145 [Thaumarchaeota archaeon]|nr:hypothetical protein [Nitrososphaerota archaeon]
MEILRILASVFPLSRIYCIIQFSALEQMSWKSLARKRKEKKEFTDEQILGSHQFIFVEPLNGMPVSMLRSI